MAISNIPPGLQAYQNLSGLEKNDNKTASQTETVQQQTTIQASEVTIRNERQASLVAHLFGDPNKAIEDSMKMTYQAAIGKLNEVLAPELGENAISQENYDKQGADYWTPESTAGRIIEGATGFLEGFKKAHPELEGEALMSHFMDVVGGGLQKGFEEAKGILQDVNVFEGKIENNYNQITDLVNKGMENFRREQLGLPPLEEADSTPNETDKAVTE